MRTRTLSVMLVTDDSNRDSPRLQQPRAVPIDAQRLRGSARAELADLLGGTTRDFAGEMMGGLVGIAGHKSDDGGTGARQRNSRSPCIAQDVVNVLQIANRCRPIWLVQPVFKSRAEKFRPSRHD